MNPLTRSLVDKLLDAVEHYLNATRADDARDAREGRARDGAAREQSARDRTTAAD